MPIPYKVCKLCSFEWNRKNSSHSSVSYYINDSCHSPDCFMRLDFSVDNHGILEMSFWRKLCWFDDISGYGTAWVKKYEDELKQIKNEDLRDKVERFLEFLGRWKFKLKTIWIILTKGWIEVEEGFTMFEKQHVKLVIEALEEGLKTMEKHGYENKKSDIENLLDMV